MRMKKDNSRVMNLFEIYMFIFEKSIDTPRSVYYNIRAVVIHGFICVEKNVYPIAPEYICIIK